MSDATTADATTQAAHHDEPTVRQYVEIAGALSVLTLMEFSTYFVEFGWLHIPILLTLMAIKFGLIVGFFMHLKYDTRLYTRLMVTGLVGALTLYGIAFLAIAEVPTLMGS
ncbi:cytochrome C oxidase subunit IV family protein [Salsipaludibacter albus]|uniref:cytochrome C oxidase subunit IV family protein n=1 Tax=Salsipaludibacter albus TaxID=2849650 RepID=UPI001EE3BB18|nr:cytochrome C oxidase subunit IV family protein [Salsipaludibacter albus]MBY5161802.1 cytochrome C oxidase subunit IV family protein [Salsipaludibacter albus]